MDKVALLPCPFCGGSAEAHNYVIEACARCNSCRATITRTHPRINDDGLPEAIAAWNSRMTTTATDKGEAHEA